MTQVAKGKQKGEEKRKLMHSSGRGKVLVVEHSGGGRGTVGLLAQFFCMLTAHILD